MNIKEEYVKKRRENYQTDGPRYEMFQRDSLKDTLIIKGKEIN